VHRVSVLCKKRLANYSNALHGRSKGTGASVAAIPSASTATVRSTLSMSTGWSSVKYSSPGMTRRMIGTIFSNAMPLSRSNKRNVLLALGSDMNTGVTAAIRGRMALKL